MGGNHPAFLFLLLDTYYLALERRFRKTYERVIERLHEGTLGATDLYVIRPSGPPARTFVSCLASWAIWPFYGMLLGMLFLMSMLLGSDVRCA